MNEKPYFLIERDESGNYFWTLVNAQERPLATSAISYTRKNDLTRALAKIKQEFEAADVFQAVECQR